MQSEPTTMADLRNFMVAGAMLEGHHMDPQVSAQVMDMARRHMGAVQRSQASWTARVGPASSPGSRRCEFSTTRIRERTVTRRMQARCARAVPPVRDPAVQAAHMPGSWLMSVHPFLCSIEVLQLSPSALWARLGRTSVGV